jgi:hypothetical protein
MKVDLTLLVPSWVLQYQTWREFLEVLEQSMNEIASNVDDLRELYNIEKAKEFIVYLARNFGFKEIALQDVEKNVQLLDNQMGFVQWKGSEEFFKWLLQLFEITVVFRDLSKEVFIWSGRRGWDRHVWEDAKYYRDGSIEVTIPVFQFWEMKELERFVCAGVYVWYMVIAGLQMFRMRSGVSVAEVDAGLSWKKVVRVSLSYGMEEDKKELFEGKSHLYAVEGVSSWGIGSEKLVVDAGLGGVGIARGEIMGGALKMVVEDGFSQKESVESMFFAKSDNRYMIVVPFRNVAPLGFTINWLAINGDTVILS